MKLDEYRIERYPNGEWGLIFDPEQRVLVFDDLKTLMRSMGGGLPKDHPDVVMIRVEIYDGAGWPENEGLSTEAYLRAQAAKCRAAGDEAGAAAHEARAAEYERGK